MSEGLRRLYADNGASGDNVRLYVGRETCYDPAWNPLYCVYGWPHLVHATDLTKCWRCGAKRREDAGD